MSRNGSGQYFAPTNSWNPATNGQLASDGDWQTTLNDIVAALTQSLSRDGQGGMLGNLPMGGNKITGLGDGTGSGQALTFSQLFDQGTEQDLASAATTDIGAQLTNFLRITGTTTITSFGTNYKGPRFLRFSGAVTLTNSSTLILPSGANITTAAGDCLIVVPKATLGVSDGWVVVAYQSASGTITPSDNSVTTAKIADNAVTQAKMADNSVGTAEIIDVNVTDAKIAGMSASKLTGDVAAARITSALNATGSAPIYACRAWVNFNGTGTVAIRGSGNVSSITDNGVGDYTVNFTNAMPDINYSITGSSSIDGSSAQAFQNNLSNFAPTVSAARIRTARCDTGGAVDGSYVSVSIFR